MAAGIPSLALSGRFEIAMKIYCRKCSSFPQSLRDSSPIVGSLSHSGVRAFEAFRGFESFPTGMIVSPLHPLRGSFPRWGTRDESAMGIYCRKCRSSPHRLRRSSPGMSLPFSAFSTCTIVQPPSRLWRQPPELRGAFPIRGGGLLRYFEGLSHFRLVLFYNLSACSAGTFPSQGRWGPIAC